MAMSSDISLIKTLGVGNELGEGVLWDESRSCIWWTDILQLTLYRYELESEKLVSYPTPERLCCFTPIEGDHRLLAAFASGFAFFDPETGVTEWIKKIEEDIIVAKTKADDLKKIEGAGPKAAEALVAAGLDTFAKVAKADPAKLSEILTEASSRLSHLVTTTWPKQAGLAAEGKWDELKELQDRLDGGIEK